MYGLEASIWRHEWQVNYDLGMTAINFAVSSSMSRPYLSATSFGESKRALQQRHSPAFWSNCLKTATEELQCLVANLSVGKFDIAF